MARWLLQASVWWIVLLLPVYAAEPVDNPTSRWTTTRPVDVFLAGNRVCRGCTVQEVGNGQLRLTNAQGKSAVYPAYQVQAVVHKRKAMWFLSKLWHGMNPVAADVLLGPDFANPPRD